MCGILDRLLTENSDKRILKEEFQLLFELVTNTLLSRSNMETILTGANMFLMKIFFKYKVVSLPTIIIEHMNFVLNDKDRRYGLPYDLWLTRVFAYFNIERGKMQVQSAK